MIEVGGFQQGTDLLTMFFRRRLTKPGIGTAAGAKNIHDNAEEGCFTAAIGAQYTEYGALWYFEGYFVESPDAPVVFCDALNREDAAHDEWLWYT